MRALACATDLLLEIAAWRAQACHGAAPGVVDLTRTPGLATIEAPATVESPSRALVTHNQVVASPLLVEQAFPLACACWEVGAPQIRNRATRGRERDQQYT